MQIPGYEILDKIAEGGMATIWKARQTSLDRLVALKVLNTRLFKEPDDIERFRREAQAAAQLRHPGLCQIYDAGEQDGAVYYIMEYVAGFSIGDLLMRKGDLPEKQALMIANGVANVLGAIWEKNRIIHCDIKPDNLLIDQDGTIRVTDLGLARVIGSMAHQIDNNYIVGTPNYASPEQARGQEDLDCRTDIYGLGATLYHMLTGLMPFADSAGEVAMERQVTDYVADPLLINPEISVAATWLLEKLMIKDRTLRYPDWQAVIHDLDEVRAGRFPLGDPPSPGQSTVSRTEEREQAMQREIDAMRPRQSPKPAAAITSQPIRRRGIKPDAGSPRLTLARSAIPSPSIPLEKSRSLLSSALRTTFTLSLSVALAYIIVFKWAPTWSQPRPEVTAPAPVLPVTPEPDRAPTTTRIPETIRSRPLPAPEPAPRPTPAPAPEVAAPIEIDPWAAPRNVPEVAVQREEPPPRSAATGEWDHPQYVQGMALLQQADTQFQKFVSTRKQSDLDNIETTLRQAIERLEACRAEAPARARVSERIRQAYQMISAVRQSRTMGN